VGDMDVRCTAAEVRRLVGSRLTAFLVNLQSVGDLDGGLEKDDGVRSRLRLVLDLAALFGTVHATGRFRAWLREVDTELGKRTCPAVLIRDSAEPALGERLTSAANRYLRTV
jgi:hypothetical protein